MISTYFLLSQSKDSLEILTAYEMENNLAFYWNRFSLFWFYVFLSLSFFFFIHSTLSHYDDHLIRASFSLSFKFCFYTFINDSTLYYLHVAFMWVKRRKIMGIYFQIKWEIKLLPHQHEIIREIFFLLHLFSFFLFRLFLFYVIGKISTKVIIRS